MGHGGVHPGVFAPYPHVFFWRLPGGNIWNRQEQISRVTVDHCWKPTFWCLHQSHSQSQNWKSPFVCSFSDSSPSITLFDRQSNMSCSLKSSTPCQAEMLWNPKEMVIVVRYAWNDPYSGGYSSVIKPSPNYSWDTFLCSSKPRDRHQRVFHRDEISKNWPSSG